jgi:DNA mismatch endonuclease (patch repair protein)
MDKVSSKTRSDIMSAIKSTDSKIEISFRKELWRKGFRYSKNSSKYMGKPDIVLKKYKTVIFLDSCFWHGCKDHCRLPKTKKEYWIGKIDRNKKRDVKVTQYYKDLDWQVIRIWEHDILSDFRGCVETTTSFLNI